MEKKLETLTVKSNLFEDLYFNEDSGLSFDKNDRVGFKENIKKMIGHPDNVIGWIKKQNEIGNPLFKTSNIKDLEIELIFEECDLQIYTRKTRREFYGLPYVNLSEIRRTQNHLNELERDLYKLEEEKTEIENSIESLETDIEKIQEDLKVLKLKKEDPK